MVTSSFQFLKRATAILIIAYDIVRLYIMNACELTASVTALVNAIACKLDYEELNLLASVLVQLGDTLVAIATHRSICENMQK